MSTWQKCPEIDKNGYRCDQKAKPGFNSMQCISKGCRNYSESLRKEYFEGFAKENKAEILYGSDTCPQCESKDEHMHYYTDGTPYWHNKSSYKIYKVDSDPEPLPFTFSLPHSSPPDFNALEEDTKPMGSD